MKPLHQALKLLREGKSFEEINESGTLSEEQMIILPGLLEALSLKAGDMEAAQPLFRLGEASFSIFNLGQFTDRKNSAHTCWCLILRLGFSNYAFATVIARPNLLTLLHYFDRAFHFFRGLPQLIRTHYVDNSLLNNVGQNETFLARLAILLKTKGIIFHVNANSPEAEEWCKAQKSEILQRITMSPKVALLLNEVKVWQKHWNIRKNTKTGESPFKVFEKVEQYFLCTLPAYLYRVKWKGRRLEHYHQQHAGSSSAGRWTKRIIQQEAQLEHVGIYAILLFLRLKKTYPKHWYSKIDQILGLKKKYPDEIINEAARRVLPKKRYLFPKLKKFCEQLYK